LQEAAENGRETHDEDDEGGKLEETFVKYLDFD